MRARIASHRRREKYWASVLAVSDGGTYRVDWDSRIRQVVEERKRALEEREVLVELVVEIVAACMKLGARASAARDSPKRPSSGPGTSRVAGRSR